MKKRKKNKFNIKKIFVLLLYIITIDSFAAIVSNNDGSAFITKSEFEIFKESYNKKIENYYNDIDSKIDNSISSYLNNLNLSVEENITVLCVTAYGNKYITYGKTLERNLWTYDGLVTGEKRIIRKSEVNNSAWTAHITRRGKKYTKMLGYNPETKETYIRNNVDITAIEFRDVAVFEDKIFSKDLESSTLYTGNLLYGTPQDRGFYGWNTMFPSNKTWNDVTTDRLWQWIEEKNSIAQVGSNAMIAGDFVCSNTNVSSIDDGMAIYWQTKACPNKIGMKVTYGSQQQFELLTGGDKSEGVHYIALPYRTGMISTTDYQWWPLNKKIRELFTDCENMYVTTIYVDSSSASYDNLFTDTYINKNAISGYTDFPNLQSSSTYLICNDVCFDSHMLGAKEFTANEARNNNYVSRNRNDFIPIYENTKTADVTIKFSITLSNTGYADIDNAGTQFYFATEKNKLVNGVPNVTNDLIDVTMNNIKKDKNNVILSSGNSASFEVVIPQGKSLWMAYKSTAPGLIGTNSKWLSFNNNGKATINWIMAV